MTDTTTPAAPAAPAVKWSKDVLRPRTYLATIGDTDWRIRGVDDLYFIESRPTGGPVSAPYNWPTPHPPYANRLSIAKATAVILANQAAKA